MSGRPELDELVVADPPGVWEGLGFTVMEGAIALGGIRIRLGAAGAGIVGWSLRGIDAGADLDGLATAARRSPRDAAQRSGDRAGR